MSQIATESVGVAPKAASDPSIPVYAGFWRRVAAAILDLCFVWFCCSVVWALLALGIGDPIRLSDMLSVGATDKCGPWRAVTHLRERCAGSGGTVVRHDNFWFMAQFVDGASRGSPGRLDSQLLGLRDLILGRLSPGAKAANKARLSGPAPPSPSRIAYRDRVRPISPAR